MTGDRIKMSLLSLSLSVFLPHPSHKDIVAEGLRQLLGEEKYRQDLTVPPGYCTGEPQWLAGGRLAGYRAWAGSQPPSLFPLQTSCSASAAPVLCFL